MLHYYYFLFTEAILNHSKPSVEDVAGKCLCDRLIRLHGSASLLCIHERRRTAAEWHVLLRDVIYCQVNPLNLD